MGAKGYVDKKSLLFMKVDKRYLHMEEMLFGMASFVVNPYPTNVENRVSS